MKMLSLIIHPLVIPNLEDFRSSSKHKLRYRFVFNENLDLDLNFIKKYLNLCSEDERRSYGFGIGLPR